MADAIERDLNRWSIDEDATPLIEVLTWLRYRLARYAASHPADPAA